jgi:hypothetical protein
LPNLSWTYSQSSTLTTTSSLSSVQFDISGLSGLGPGGFYLRMYFAGTGYRFYESNTEGCSKLTYLSGNSISYQTNVTGSETLISSGVLRWQAMGE